ncbi:MAG TPA: TOBE domain-containing protein, partial [Burkholderiaceae bacterium]|nr:TOBE domain-containing protein [Burkholderiaceae bacterium]
SVFLFDEPLSNLDAALRVKMRFEFAKLHQELKTTMIYVTHDQVEAMTLADRIVVLSAGRLEQVGTPMELYEHPVNRFVAGFIGSPQMNFLDAELVERSAGHAIVRVPSGETVRASVDASRAQPGDRVALGIRPEHLQVDGTENRLVAEVRFVESLGSATQMYCAAAGSEELSCTLDGRTRLVQGQQVALSVPANACYLFDAAGEAFRRTAPDLGSGQ